MADLQDVHAVLKLCGAELLSSNGHHKYRLPTGKRFTLPATPSDVRSADNCLALLRRELKDYPDVVNYKRSHPKSKRPTTTLGEALSVKAPDILHALQPPPPEIDFSLLDAPEVEAQAEPIQSLHYPPRRQQPKPPPPSPARTLSQEQMDEANRILHTEGEQAMAAYINLCRESMVATSPHLTALRCSPAPVQHPLQHPAPHLQTHDHPANQEEQQMTSTVERAQRALAAVCTRLTEYESQITDLMNRQTEDEGHKRQLEAFLAKHDELAEAALSVLPLLPAEPVAPLPPPPLPLVSKGLTGHAQHPCGIRQLRQIIFPAMQSKGIARFNTRDLIREIEASGLFPPDVIPARSKLSQTLFVEIERPSSTLIKHPERGYFMFKSEATMGTEAQTEVAHA